MLIKLKNYFVNQSRLSKEILMAQIFRDSINDTEWIKNKSFSASGGSANYSFLYILFRILNDIQPKSILEFGLGQTSKLTTQYVAHKNQDSQLIIFEHDNNWVNFFKPHLANSNNITLLLSEVQEIDYKGHSSSFYNNINKIVQDNKFDLILVDGPPGTGRYSRIGVVNLVPDNLSDSFVIIIDDCDRMGEKETAEEVVKKLNANNISFEKTLYGGIKHQYVIYSKDLYFLETL